MPTNTKYLAQLYPGDYYHIYNRTNNQELLFKNDKNRHYFLHKYKMYLFPYLHTFAYCLLGNHFHLLVQVKSERQILLALQTTLENKRTKLQETVLQQPKARIPFPELIHQQFRRFFTTYAMSFNQQYGRKGNLFHRPFKRVWVKNSQHFTRLIYYIHANPYLHQLCT